MRCAREWFGRVIWPLAILVFLGWVGVAVAQDARRRPADSDSAQAAASVTQSQVDLDARIQQLIQQLGSSQYATRQRAKTELKRLRLEAFDALNEAQENDDIEIALSARYLVRSMQVNWWTDEDSPEVKQLLRGYGGRPDPERR